MQGAGMIPSALPHAAALVALDGDAAWALRAASPSTLARACDPTLGAGKSTLLDTLAGRLGSSAKSSGDILVNGHKAQLSFGRSAYVTQDGEQGSGAHAGWGAARRARWATGGPFLKQTTHTQKKKKYTTRAALGRQC